MKLTDLNREAARIKKKNYFSLSVVGLALLSITTALIRGYLTNQSGEIVQLHLPAWQLLTLILLVSFISLLSYPWARHHSLWRKISLICPLLSFIATIIIALLGFDGSTTIQLVISASIGLLASAATFFSPSLKNALIDVDKCSAIVINVNHSTPARIKLRTTP